VDELLESLRSYFAEAIPDGRRVVVRLDSPEGDGQLVARVSGYGIGKLIATVTESETGYLVEDSQGAVVRCRSCDEVAGEIERLAVYSSGCWYCKRPIVLTAESRCPRCKRFVLCSCGKCLCDKYPERPALSPEEVAALVRELTRRYGHLFQGKGSGRREDNQDKTRG